MDRSVPSGVGATDGDRARRWAGTLLGDRSIRRLVAVHAVDNAADALVSLSLVGSLFFNASLEASRGRILLYLLLTATPLALIAPVVGRAVDRHRDGCRAVIIASHAARAVLVVALARSLLSLAFYPLVFGVLLSRKAYSLGRAAILPYLTPDQLLVSASAQLSRTGTVAAGCGMGVGGVILGMFGSHWLMLSAAPCFAVAAWLAIGMPPIADPASAGDADIATGTATESVSTPEVHLVTWAVATTRAATGALTFLLAFAIKRGGEGVWVYAAGLIASGVGAFLGTAVAGRLRRTLSAERMVALALVVPGLVCGAGVLTIGNLSIVAIAFSIGLGTSVASRSMDAFYGRSPAPTRGRLIARSEVRFQIANLLGASVAVIATPTPRLGFGVVAVVLLVIGIAYASRARVSLRGDALGLLARRGARSADGDLDLELPAALLVEAERFAAIGGHRLAICVADCAVRAARAGAEGDCAPVEESRWERLAPTVVSVISSERSPSPAETTAILGAAREVVEHATRRPVPPPVKGPAPR
jgi:hypothetical protein